jgi:hypothetical protein
MGGASKTKPVAGAVITLRLILRAVIKRADPSRCSRQWRVILLQPIGRQRNGARSIVTAGDDPGGCRNYHSGRESPLFELHHGGRDVLTPRTFKGTEIETRVLRLNARQIHLRRAFWARRPYINWRVFKRVFRKGHLRLLLLKVGALPNFHSLTPDYVAVGVPQYDSASGTVQNSSQPGIWIT